MNPVKEIGRYTLPILNVTVIEKRPGKRGGFKVYLTNGATILFNAAEKKAYDEAMAVHTETMRIYGMAKGLGLRG